MSIPADTPAAVITSPLSTKRSSGRTSISRPSVGSTSSEPQCVVAGRPSSRPASASTSEPVQTLVTSAPRSAWPRTQARTASSPSCGLVPRRRDRRARRRAAPSPTSRPGARAGPSRSVTGPSSRATVKTRDAVVRELLRPRGEHLPRPGPVELLGAVEERDPDRRRHEKTLSVRFPVAVGSDRGHSGRRMRTRTRRAVTLALLAAGVAAVAGASTAHRAPAASARPLVAQPARSRAVELAAPDLAVPLGARDPLLLAGAAGGGLQPRLAPRGRDHGRRPDDRDRRQLRLAHDPPRPAPLRPDLRRRELRRRADRPGDREGPEAHDHPARRQGAEVPRVQPGHGRLGRRDDARRRVGARLRAGREHPARRDAGQRDRGRPRVPADDQGRELRDQAPPRERDLAELRRDREHLQDHEVAARAAERVQARREEPRDRPRRLGRHRLDRLQGERRRPVPVPGQQLALERPARDERRRHAAEPRRHGQPPLAGHRLERPQRRRRRRAQPHLRPPGLPERGERGRRRARAARPTSA